MSSGKGVSGVLDYAIYSFDVCSGVKRDEFGDL